MLETEKAWMAGLLDGEGSISCRWPKRSNVSVELSMTHAPTLEKVQSLFPGLIVSKRNNGYGRKMLFRWRADTNRSKEVLTALLPYLVTKREQAILALKLCERPSIKPFKDMWALALRSLNS